jgi:type VI secretion system protein ImpK
MLRLGFDRDRRYAPPALESRPVDVPDLDELTTGPPSAADGAVDGGPFNPQRSFLLTSFRTFFAEVTRLRSMVDRDPTALVPPPDSASSQDSGPAAMARAVRLRLQHTLEQLAIEAGTRGGDYGASLFGEAQYVMAAAADEIFLTTDWPGRDAWLGMLLERAMFDTQIAGEELFRRLDKLLLNRTGINAELGAVYFMALSLGFEGQFRGTDPLALRSYRQRLYRFVFQRDVSRVTGVLVPQPYEHIAPAARPTRLPLVQRWAIILGVTALAYFVVSQIIWRNTTSDIRAIHADIRSVIADTARTTP